MKSESQSTQDGVKKIAEQFNRMIGDDLLRTWVEIFAQCDARDVESAFNSAVAGDHFPSIPEVKGLVKMARERREEKENGAEKAAEMARRQAEHDAARARRLAAEQSKRIVITTCNDELMAIYDKFHSQKTIGMDRESTYEFCNQYASALRAHILETCPAAKPDWNEIYQEKVTRCLHVQEIAQEKQKAQEAKNGQ